MLASWQLGKHVEQTSIHVQNIPAAERENSMLHQAGSGQECIVVGTSAEPGNAYT